MTHPVTRSVLRWWILLLPPTLLVVALGMLTGADGSAEDPFGIDRDDLGLDSDAPAGLIRLRSEENAATRTSDSRRGAPSSAGDTQCRDPDAVPSTGLAGRVLGPDGRAVVGALVTLTTAGAAPPATVGTDAAGRFRFAAVATGQLVVSAESAPFGPAWVRDVVAGTWVELRLQAAARLEVEVRDAAEDLTARAVVHVRRPGFAREAVTDAQGRAAFEGLPAGVAEVRVRAADGAVAVHRVVLDAERTVQITCALSVPGRIRGRVVDGVSGQPVAGARVTLHALQSQNLDDPMCLSDDGGAFELVDAFGQAASVQVIATKAGYAAGRTTPRSGSGACDVVLTPQRRLHGRVIDTRGRPVARARIAWAESFGDETLAVSDVRGRFSVSLPTAPTDGSLHALTATTSSGGYGAAAVRLGANDESIVVVVRGGASLSGRVRDTTGRALSGALVTLSASSAHVPALAESGDEAWARSRGLTAMARAVSDADGAYHLPRMPAGAWMVRVVRGAADLRLREPVLLSEGADVSLDLTVGAVEALFGRVVDATGRGVAGARVLAIPARETSTATQSRATTSTADGVYRLDALGTEGRYDLVVSAPGYAPERLLDVAPGARALDVRLAPPARITGSVEQAGAPYGGSVELWLVPAFPSRDADGAGGGIPVPAQRVGLARSEDAAGRFALELPHAGSWLVCARTSDGGAVAAPQAVHVEAGQGVSDVTLRLDAAAAIRGHLRSASPATDRPDGVVSLHPWAGHEILARPVAAAHARADGAFELYGLPSGSYRLRIQEPDGTTSQRDVTLTPGAVLEVDFANSARP